MTLWGGAFREPTDDAVRRLNDSLPFDWRLYDVDITASQAWAEALCRAGILTPEECQLIVDGLERVRQTFATGEFAPAPGDEDIHTAVERCLTALIGPVAGKLHTGRSRNDQVAVDLRLWVTQATPPVAEQIRQLQRALLDQATEHVHSVMPGLTHFQPAQPITAAHWLLSYVAMLQRDRSRFDQVIAAASGQCPLGSGALAGTPYPIDRPVLAAALGFREASTNSLDAVSDRDFVVEFLHAAALLMTHLSRLAEDLIIYSNPQFGFVTLDERYSTGSSLMPQKRNPDPLELTRGKTGRVIGHLAGLLTTLKGLPSGYNKDLQEDKEPLFDAHDTLLLILPVLTALVASMQIHPQRMRTALDEAMLATDLADYLVARGVPFRQAHHLVGQAVRRAEELTVKLSDLPLPEFQKISPDFGSDVYTVFDFDQAVARRRPLGGTAPETVAEQIGRWKEVLG